MAKELVSRWRRVGAHLFLTVNNFAFFITFRDFPGSDLDVTMSPPNNEVPPDQVILATGGYDHSIRFWSAFNGQCIKTAQHPDSVSSLFDCLTFSQLFLL